MSDYSDYLQTSFGSFTRSGLSISTAVGFVSPFVRNTYCKFQVKDEDVKVFFQKTMAEINEMSGCVKPGHAQIYEQAKRMVVGKCMDETFHISAYLMASTVLFGAALLVGKCLFSRKIEQKNKRE